MSTVSPLERDFINRFQGGFPLTGHPFSRVAASLGTREVTLIQTLQSLLGRGLLSRFGPLFDAERLGGELTLAALAVPEPEFARVTAEVNTLARVAHNYRRDHRLNMWFVVASGEAGGVAQTLATITRRTGLPVYDFPRQQTFYLGLQLRLGQHGDIDTVPVDGDPPAVADCRLDDLDRRLLRATQSGLPLHSDPWDVLAKQLDCRAGLVLERLQRLLDNGAVRRIGAVPNHYRLGLRGNGMSVWNVPDDQAAELGRRVGGLDFVSHCYLRPRHAGVWPYNLFAMVHGRDRAVVTTRVRQIEALLGEHCLEHDTLFSSAVLKKTGLRLAA